MAQIRSCKNCVYREMSDDTCRRRAPVGLTVTYEEDEPEIAGTITVWPVVKQSDWCGDFMIQDHL